MGGRNAMYFTSKRPDLVQTLVVVDIGPEISPRAAQVPAGAPEPDSWESIEQAAQHLYRANPYPGIHYYRWVVSHSLRQRPDGGLVWKWHPSIKERQSQPDIDWWAIVRAITRPTLVLRGEGSHVLDRHVAERMAKELPNGPSSAASARTRPSSPVLAAVTAAVFGRPVRLDCPPIAMMLPRRRSFIAGTTARAR